MERTGNVRCFGTMGVFCIDNYNTKRYNDSTLIVTQHSVLHGGDSMRDNIKGGALTETTFLILLALYTPRHGYGINRLIDDATDSRVSLGAGTLYKALDTLVAKGWIESYGEDGRKKEYIITEAGKSIVENEKTRLIQVLNIANLMTRGENHE